MAYDENLALRVRSLLTDQQHLVERKMFGGVGFLLHGNMACGVHGENLIVRIGPEHYEEALSVPITREFDITGRPMKGWVSVIPQGIAADEDLDYWVQEGVQFALTLPAK